MTSSTTSPARPDGRAHQSASSDAAAFRSASVSFGPFRLYPAARRVEKGGVLFPLSSRALDILIVLVEHASEIVGHRDLTARVWRNLEVGTGSLRTHIAGLRKALGDGEGGARYIANVAGQGYCFVAPIFRSTPSEPAPSPARADAHDGAAFRMRALPPLLARMVGRDEASRAISRDLIAHRFLSIVGPGGMGKTTVAVAVAHALRGSFADAVCFVDLSALSNPAHVASTVASTLGLTIQAEDALPELRESLRRSRMLLVLDNCEHVMDAAAVLSEEIFRVAPEVHILATSREALRVAGECTYLLPPLEYPSPDARLDAAAAQAFPAVRLFIECAAATGSRFELSDADAPIVASICGRLDGIALAIEFAAGRVGAYGINGIDALLNSRFGLEWPGRRTAPQRHQTLHATLDWSHDLLSESERAVLRRLSIFVGSFTLEAAQAVARAGTVDNDRVVINVGELVAKSVVSSVVGSDRSLRYRLMETTRAYAIEKLDESGELDATAERHAAYFTRLFDAAAGGGIDPHRDDQALELVEHLGNVRAALAWCFGGPADTPRQTSLGVDLAAAAAPVLMQLLLFNEALRWSTAALSMLRDSDRLTAKEMVLQETLAIASMWTRSNGSDLGRAITRGLEIANHLGHPAPKLRWMVGMHIYLLRMGDFAATREVAEALNGLARTSEDASYKVMSDWLRGSSAHFMGDQQAARQYFQDGFGRTGPRKLQLFGLDYRVRALVTFSRVLWLSGCPDRAMEVAREAISEAETFGRPLDVCFSLLYTTSVFLWCGDWTTAQRSFSQLTQHTNWPSLSSFHSTGQALEGELLLNMGEAERGIAMLRAALRSMRDQRQLLFFMRAAGALAGGLIGQGQPGDALAVVNDAIAETEGGPEGTELAELLRLRAEALMRLPDSDPARVKEALMRSLECARRQRALSLELRTATTLARLRAIQGDREDAYRVLDSAHRSFTEGFGTPDIQSAERLLKELAPTAAGHQGRRARRIKTLEVIPAPPEVHAPSQGRPCRDLR
ncbi:winged helix-turn-helix domain-containing protein [Variovorax sp. J2P1-59]|uniref:ATP-binding protein n=1 Tax=Variovorax flavidus TaxID=3053501 RepID=UPI0025753FA3|nr:winged helix-turn-helix domain-containing protein [Variovorax sp. J2P1-59]MDM0074069.1 winged helix-turn-helix domain-containing protein [Variovorax sp. J2P1-59]